MIPAQCPPGHEMKDPIIEARISDYQKKITRLEEKIAAYQWHIEEVLKPQLEGE